MVIGVGVLSRLGLMDCVEKVVCMGCHPPFVTNRGGGATRDFLLEACRCLLYVSRASGPVEESIMVW